MASKKPLTAKQRKEEAERLRKLEEEEKQRVADIERAKAEQAANDLLEFQTMPRAHLSIK